MPNLLIELQGSLADFDCACGKEFRDAEPEKIIIHQEQHTKDWIILRDSQRGIYE